MAENERSLNKMGVTSAQLHLMVLVLEEKEALDGCREIVGKPQEPLLGSADHGNARKRRDNIISLSNPGLLALRRFVFHASQVKDTGMVWYVSVQNERTVRATSGRSGYTIVGVPDGL